MSTQTAQTNPTENNKPAEPDYYFENFIGTHVISSDPVEKKYPGGKYNEIPLRYNYGTEENPIIDHCFIELPEVKSFGIVKKVEEKKAQKEGDPPYIKESYSMMFVFNLQDDEHRACLAKFDELFDGCCHALDAQKRKIGMHSFDPERPGESFKNPVYYKIDSMTGERIAGQNPSLWVKMSHWTNNKTLFTSVETEKGPGGDEIPKKIEWELLYDVEVKMHPLLQIAHIHAGTKTSIQVKLESGIVTDIVPAGSTSRQTRTLDRIRKKNGGLADKIGAQIANLRMTRQDALGDTGAHYDAVAHLPSDAGNMNTIPNVGATSTSDSLNSYLGGAPSMAAAPAQQFPTQPPTQQFATQPPTQQFQAQLPQTQLPQAPLPQAPQVQVQVPQQTYQAPVQPVVPQQVQLNSVPQQQVQFNPGATQQPVQFN